MARRKSHAKTVYLVRRDNLPTIDFTLRDNERPAPGKYLDPLDPETWRPVDLSGKNLTGWFKEMCVNGNILFGIPVVRHAPLTEGRCTLLGSPSALMDIPPGWYELEVEMHSCATSYKQTVWKRFKFCVREEFDTSEADGLVAPIYRDANGVLQEVLVSPPYCEPDTPTFRHVAKDVTTYTLTGTASDPDGNIVRVDYRLNGGAWFQASIFVDPDTPGLIDWTAIVPGLVVGENRIEVRSVDDGYDGTDPALCSVVLECLVYREANAPPTLTVNCGDLPDPETPNACFDGIIRGELLP